MKQTLNRVKFSTDIEINCSLLFNAEIVEAIADSIPRLLELGINCLQDLWVCLTSEQSLKPLDGK